MVRSTTHTRLPDLRKPMAGNRIMRLINGPSGRLTIHDPLEGEPDIQAADRSAHCLTRTTGFEGHRWAAGAALP